MFCCRFALHQCGGPCSQQRWSAPSSLLSWWQAQGTFSSSSRGCLNTATTMSSAACWGGSKPITSSVNWWALGCTKQPMSVHVLLSHCVCRHKCALHAVHVLACINTTFAVNSQVHLQLLPSVLKLTACTTFMTLAPLACKIAPCIECPPRKQGLSCLGEYRELFTY